MSPELIECRRCGRELPAHEFQRHPTCANGIRPRCRRCCVVLYRERVGFPRAACWLHKPCRICGDEKPISDFPRRRGTFDGRDTRCQECNNRQRREAWQEKSASASA